MSSMNLDEMSRKEILCHVLDEMFSPVSTIPPPTMSVWDGIFNVTVFSADRNMRLAAVEKIEEFLNSPGWVEFGREFAGRFPNWRYGEFDAVGVQEVAAKFALNIVGCLELRRSINIFYEGLCNLSGAPAGIIRFPATLGIENRWTIDAESEDEPRTLADFPHIWELFSFLLSQKVRQEVFEPYHAELKADYVQAKSVCRSPRDAQLINMCFGLRSVAMVAQSLFAAANDRTCHWSKWALRVVLGERAFRALWIILEEFCRK
jgi:hypothetical protein